MLAGGMRNPYVAAACVPPRRRGPRIARPAEKCGVAQASPARRPARWENVVAWQEVKLNGARPANNVMARYLNRLVCR